MVNLNKVRWGFAYLEWFILDILAPVKVLLLITMKAGRFLHRNYFLIGFLNMYQVKTKLQSFRALFITPSSTAVTYSIAKIKL